MNFLKKEDRGFALVEVTIAVAIVAILSTVVIASVQEGRKKARDAQRISDLQQVQVALRLYKDENGAYPVVDDGRAIIGDGGTFDDLVTEYLTVPVRDPVGSAWPIENFFTGTAFAGVLMPVNPYTYYYDTGFECSALGYVAKKMLIASTMELPASSNWATVCGDLPPGGVNSFGIILQ